MGNEALVMGYETALDFWRASRVASEGQHVLEDAGRVFGPRALELHERAALAANLCNSSVPVDAVVVTGVSGSGAGPFAIASLPARSPSLTCMLSTST